MKVTEHTDPKLAAYIEEQDAKLKATVYKIVCMFLVAAAAGLLGCNDNTGGTPKPVATVAPAPTRNPNDGEPLENEQSTMGAKPEGVPIKVIVTYP